MDAKEEVRYLNKHWKKMRMSLKNFLKTNDLEQLHIMRVEVKKLRAMLTLIQTLAHNKKLQKHFKPVRKVFKHAGEIRNAQVNIDLAKEYQLHNDNFASSQQQLIVEGAAAFKRKAPKYLKSIKKSHQKIKDSLKRVPNKSVARFYRQQLKQIGNSMAIPHFDEGLHDCRKQMKVLMYNHTLTGKSLQDRVEFNEEYIDHLQSSIGNWHDHVLAIDLFESPEIKDIPVATKIKKQNRRTEKDITDLSRDFFIKATTPVVQDNHQAKEE